MRSVDVSMCKYVYTMHTMVELVGDCSTVCRQSSVMVYLPHLMVSHGQISNPLGSTREAQLRSFVQGKCSCIAMVVNRVKCSCNTAVGMTE